MTHTAEPTTEQKQLDIDQMVKINDIIRLNVGGEIILTTRKTLVSVSKSVLSKLFNGRWEGKLRDDSTATVFLDFNPALFRHLLEQLRRVSNDPSPHFSAPPAASTLIIRAFSRMLIKLDLHSSEPSPSQTIALNVGGDPVSTDKTTLHSSKSAALTNGSFIDADPSLFRHLLEQ